MACCMDTCYNWLIRISSIYASWQFSDIEKRGVVEMSAIQISISNVSFGYDKTENILNDISLEAEEKESIGIIGANGVGKSTLLKILVGLYTEFEGSINVAGIPVEKKTLQVVREKIGYVFQDSDSQLFMSTVYEDVAFAPRNYGLSEQETKEKVMQALKSVHIEHLRDRQIYKLSGGEKKLASIATILSMTPEIILMDEPSIALDPKNRRNLIHVLNQLEQLKLIASHDLDLILDTCDRTILINHGKIIKDGRTKEILTDKKLLEDNGLELPLRYYQN